MDDWDSRKTLLEIGVTYRVLPAAVDFKGHDLVCGEQLLLDRVDYSRYDSCHVYSFSAQDGTKRQFWLTDEQPRDDLCRSLEAER
jgi:hypothetical protein